MRRTTGGRTAGTGRSLLPVVVLLLVAACGGAPPVAHVDGVRLERGDLDALHPDGADGLDDEQLGASLTLMVVHEALTTAARRQFDVEATDAQVGDAYDDRVDGLGPDVDGALRDRDVTRARVRLESELDVVRSALEPRLVADGGREVLEAAYRTVLSTNARACLSAATVADDVRAEVERAVDGGAGIAELVADHPGSVDPFEVGCATPVELGPGLSSVAIDAALGRPHVVDAPQGTVVATVDRRDAPSLDEVRDEVVEVAVREQGPELFNAWAARVLRRSDVVIDDDLGVWRPTDGTGDVPTVVVR